MKAECKVSALKESYTDDLVVFRGKSQEFGLSADSVFLVPHKPGVFVFNLWI